MNIFFLPKWYLKHKLVERNNKLKLLAAIFLIVNIILLDCIIVERNKLKTLNKSIQNKKSEYGLSYSKGMNDNPASIETYMDFFNQFKKYGEFKNIKVEGHNIEMEFGGNDELLSQFIKHIEDSNEFIIMNIAYLEDNYMDIPKSQINKKFWKITLKHK